MMHLSKLLSGSPQTFALSIAMVKQVSWFKGEQRKTKAVETVHGCLMGWEAPVSWGSWLLCPVLLLQPPGHMAGWGWLLAGLWWRECYSTLLLFLQ